MLTPGYQQFTNSVCGNDYATATDSASLSITGNITVECFVIVSSTATPMVFVSKRRNTAGNGGYELYMTAGGYLNFSTYNNSASVKRTATSTGTIPTGGWVHVAGEYNSATKRMSTHIGGFGTSMSDTTTDGAPENGGSNLQLGRLLTGPGGSGQCLVGSLECVRISSSIRYAQPTFPNTQSYFVPISYTVDASTKAQYLFNNDTGVTHATDSSGNGNHLSFTGTTDQSGGAF